MERALYDRYAYTLHGFNVYYGYQMIGRVYQASAIWTGQRLVTHYRHLSFKELDQLMEHLRRTMNLGKEINTRSNYSEYCIGVVFELRSLIPDLVGHVLKQGYSIRLETRLRPLYQPGDSFSMEKSEEKYLVEIEKCGQTLPSSLSSDAWLLSDSELWKTKLGRYFAQRVRERFTPEIVTTQKWSINTWDDALLDFPLYKAKLI